MPLNTESGIFNDVDVLTLTKLFDEPLVKELFKSMHVKLAQTIINTPLDAHEQREHIYVLNQAVLLLESEIQAVANTFHLKQVGDSHVNI